MKEHGLLYKGEEIRAIHDWRKTVTRRLVKSPEQWMIEFDGEHFWFQDKYGESQRLIDHSPYQAGDRIWCRETWAEIGFSEGDVKIHRKTDNYGYTDCKIIYREENPNFIWTDGDGLQTERQDGSEASYWKSPIHMPKWACRLWLEIVSVRVERLQDISPEDCEYEGITGATHPSPVNGLPYDIYSMNGNEYSTPREAFSALWDSTAKPGFKWIDNPLVYPVEFKIVEA